MQLYTISHILLGFSSVLTGLEPAPSGLNVRYCHQFNYRTNVKIYMFLDVIYNIFSNHICGGSRARTYAPISRPVALAERSLHQLGYTSK